MRGLGQRSEFILCLTDMFGELGGFCINKLSADKGGNLDALQHE